MSNKNILKKTLSAFLSTATLAASFTIGGASITTASAADNNYAEALKLSLYFYDANHCGCEVDDNPLTWRSNCHTYDANAKLSDASNFNSSYTSIVDPDGDGCVDVSGGYHDAGDHVKFNLTNGFAGSSLAMSYYLNDGAYEKAGCEDHLFALLKSISSYLMKTTFLNSDGSVATICYNVSDSSDHSWWQSPEVQTYSRKTYWMSSSNNNVTICGEMASALAGAAYVLKDSDPSFSSECLKYAKAIYDFGTKYNGNELDGMGNMYGTADGTDELALANAWLYLNDQAPLPTYTPTGNGCYNNSVYDYHYYCWDKVWSGYASMMYKITGETSFKNEMLFELNNKGGVPTDKYNATDQGSWGGSRYNCALQMLALGVADGDASSQYALGAKYQMDYILGNNSVQGGYSFLIGYGNKWPTHIHHRAANPGNSSATQSGDVEKDNTEAKYTCFGALIGGPSDSNGTYNDVTNSYQYTEPALDYNACFALACAGLVNLFDNTSTSMVDWISSEFVQDYKFNSGSSQTKEYSATIKIVDSKTDELLSDVELQLASSKDPANAIEKWNSSDSNPKTFNNLDKDVDYTISVLNAPDNYVIANPQSFNFADTETQNVIIKLDYKEESIIYGDSNGDGSANLADAVFIMQSLANPEKYILSEEALKNSDVFQRGDGVNAQDALSIQKFSTGLIENLPESYMQ